MSVARAVMDMLTLFYPHISAAGIAPGSRSTPLVVATQKIVDPKSICVHFDERGLGFWGVGVGKATLKPAVLVVTSGTAVANLLPSVIEAYYSFTPLIILSADRPAELIDVGSNQAIRQTEFLKPYCRFFADLQPVESRTVSDHWLEVTLKAISALKTAPPGPIHLNVRFREPVWDGGNCDISPANRSFQLPERPAWGGNPIGAGVIVIGENAGNDMSTTIGSVPIIADGLCGRVYSAPGVIETSDWWDTNVIDAVPEVLLQLGGKVLSKPIAAVISDAEHYIHATPYPELADPSLRAKEWVVAPIQAVISNIQPINDSGRFDTVYAEFETRLRKLSYEFEREWSELSIFAILQRVLSDQFSIFVGNSLPIRMWSMTRHLAKSPYSVTLNRGASGIDGLIATAVGAGFGNGTPCMTILGDLSALHDLNSLALRTPNPNHVVVVINNDGGGIFRHLPVQTYEHHDPFFRMPHGYGFSHIAAQFGFEYSRIEGLDAWRAFVTDHISTCSGRWLLELVVDPGATVSHIQQIKQKLRRDL